MGIHPPPPTRVVCRQGGAPVAPGGRGPPGRGRRVIIYPPPRSGNFPDAFPAFGAAAADATGATGATSRSISEGNRVADDDR